MNAPFPGQFVRSPFFFHAWSRFDDSPASVQRRIQARWKSNDMTLARDAVIYQMLLPCVRTDRSQGARVKRKKKKLQWLAINQTKWATKM